MEHSANTDVSVPFQRSVQASDVVDAAEKTEALRFDLPEVTEPMLDRLIHDMNTTGFGVILSYVPAEQLDRMRRFVSSAIAAAGQKYAGFVGRDAVSGSAFSELSEKAEFRDLMRRVYERGTGRVAPDTDIHQVLRCLAGESGTAHSLIFHYDSFVVTALIPVEIPREGQSGDLVMLPNTRLVRGSYIANLADKVLLDNRLTQAAMRILHNRGRLPVRRIQMTPGNIYFFWGYRSIHANEPCDPRQVRATALYHFANPHAESSLRTKVRAMLPR